MIKFVDMFSGIGGFREGLTRAGGFECVGHCEIDKYANRSYNALFDTKGEWFIEDARKADPSTMPDFQLLCGGFPCQTFSIAGSRKGFGDPRGTLFFELARLAEARKPPYLLFENVVGLINHDHCRTFATILNTLDRLGYGVEWQCLNSKDFGVPQSRNRVYIVGYLDERCRGKVFPFTETTGGSQYSNPRHWHQSGWRRGKKPGRTPQKDQNLHGDSMATPIRWLLIAHTLRGLPKLLMGCMRSHQWDLARVSLAQCMPQKTGSVRGAQLECLRLQALVGDSIDR